MVKVKVMAQTEWRLTRTGMSPRAQARSDTASIDSIRRVGGIEVVEMSFLGFGVGSSSVTSKSPRVVRRGTNRHRQKVDDECGSGRRWEEDEIGNAWLS